MKKLILSELILIFLATTFMTDAPPPGWYQQTLPTGKPITDIFFVDSIHGWVSVSSGQVYDSAKILATSDGGNTWVTQFAKDTLILNAIQFLNLNTGYCVGGFREVLKTMNAGQNWLPVNTPGTEYFTDLYFVNTDTGWICDPYSFGGVFKTINGGTSWQQQIGAGHYIGKLFFLNKDTGWATGIHDTLLRTTNGGANWNLQYVFTSTAPGLFFISKDTGWVTGGGGGTGIMETTNGGFNWYPANNPTPYGPAQIFFIDNKHGWAGSGLSRIVATKDGVNWGYQTAPNYNHYTVVFTDTLRGWAGGGGNDVIHTTDGGGPPLGILYGSSKADEYRLDQNFPNPFNSTTIIIFQIREKSSLELKIFDITGKEVKTLLDDDHYTSGTYQFGYDGSRLSSGVYFYRLIVKSEVSDKVFTDTKKMVLIK